MSVSIGRVPKMSLALLSTQKFFHVLIKLPTRRSVIIDHLKSEWVFNFGNFPDCLESFRAVRKISGQSEKFLNSLKSLPTFCVSDMLTTATRDLFVYLIAMYCDLSFIWHLSYYRYCCSAIIRYCSLLPSANQEWTDKSFTSSMRMPAKSKLTRSVWIAHLKLANKFYISMSKGSGCAPAHV